MIELTTDILIIGAGPAGLAAVLGAHREGITDMILVEREDELGGILRQCIHNGFGLHMFGEELTGPEYAQRYIKEVQSTGVKIMLKTSVIDLKPDKTAVIMSESEGMMKIIPKAVVLAMGCRERAAGSITIPGFRGAGILTAGLAQDYVNLKGYMPGKEVVVLGSGDIGLIMARRLTYSGAKVKACIEVMPYSSGLKRNIVQCLHDYDIPLMLSHTVTEIHGKKRVEGVTVSKVDDLRQPIAGSEFFIKCDTLLLSIGLIPENELSKKAGVTLDADTKGPVIFSDYSTDAPGIFACGNVLHVNDLADNVSKESEMAGKAAARYVKAGTRKTRDAIEILHDENITACVPQRIDFDESEEISISFRPTRVLENVYVALYAGDKLIKRRKKRILTPGLIEQMELAKRDMAQIKAARDVCLKVEEE